MRRLASSLIVLTMAGGLLVGVAPAASAVTTTLTLSATPPTGNLGDQISLDGTLAFGDASPAEGETIDLSRTEWDGSVTSLADAVVEADGTFHVDDSPPKGGDLTYTATFVAHDAFDGAVATDTVDLQRPASSVTASASKQTITFGDTITVTGHLGPSSDSDELTITATPVGGGEQELITGDVNGNRNLQVTHRPNRTTTYTVSFAGDGGHEASSAQATTQVKVKVTARLVDFRSKQGKYRIYGRGGRAKMRIKVSPNHFGFSVNGYLEGYVNGAWTPFDSGAAPLSPSSTQLFKAFGSSGVKWRMRAEMVGHADHLGNFSPWRYFRFA